MPKKVVVLAPPSAPVQQRTAEYNALAQKLGEDLEFVLVDSDADLGTVAKASEGAIAVTTPAYRLLRKDVVNELAARVPTIKLLQASSAGTEAFDKVALAALGVTVANHGGGNAVAVAEHAIALMFSVYRKLDQQFEAVRGGQWNSPITTQPIAEFRTLVGKRVGIIGFGNIGSRIAQRLAGWECELVYADDHVKDPSVAIACGAKRVALSTLLTTSDVVSLNVPLEGSTRHLLSDKEFATMKPDAIVINTSRGAVIDEAALIRALATGKIFGAGLDVVEEEPLTLTSPLNALPNVVITPHVGTRALETEHNIYNFVVQNIGRHARGEAILSVVRPQ